MPTVDENAALWDVRYDWSAHGEEWSEAWGGSEAQWNGTVLPRIGPSLPAETILEIAPGYGRWTRFLREHCQRLVIVDLSEQCIQACRERFAGDDGIAYHVNDGRSLSMLDDESIDFVFSFDSLVHVDVGVISDYLRELARTLRPSGTGFIHHSNAGAYGHYFGRVRRLRPGVVVSRLRTAGLVDNDGWRALDMTATQFRAACTAAGLHCVEQELVNWHSRRLIDCLSTFARSPEAARRPTRIVENPRFMLEAARVKHAAEVNGVS